MPSATSSSSTTAGPAPAPAGFAAPLSGAGDEGSPSGAIKQRQAKELLPATSAGASSGGGGGDDNGSAWPPGAAGFGDEELEDIEGASSQEGGAALRLLFCSSC